MCGRQSLECCAKLNAPHYLPSSIERILVPTRHRKQVKTIQDCALRNQLHHLGSTNKTTWLLPLFSMGSGFGLDENNNSLCELRRCVIWFGGRRRVTDPVANIHTMGKPFWALFLGKASMVSPLIYRRYFRRRRLRMGLSAWRAELNLAPILPSRQSFSSAAELSRAGLNACD